MSGMREEVYLPADYDSISAEKPIGADRKDSLVAGTGGRRGGSYAIVALEEVFGVRAVTIRTWLCRSGMQGKKLHERFIAELRLVHVQLDELWANVKDRGQDMWLWIVSDAKTKIIPVMQVGPRNQDAAYSVVHELKGRLAAGCVPVFSTDGLKHYFYALTAHFGKWVTADRKKPVWMLLNDLVYSQVIKHHRRRKTVEVERRVLIGEAGSYANDSVGSV